MNDENTPDGYGDTALRCPACGNTTDDFSIAAVIQVFVSAMDYTTINRFSEEDVEYGNDSRCTCTKCGNAGKLAEFRRADQPTD